MKQLFTFLFVITTLIACTTKESRLVIDGKITNPTDSNVRFQFADSTYTAELDSLGSFRLDITFDSAQYGTFIHGPERSSIYLLPNSQLKLTIDTEQFDETITLTGENSNPSSYLFQSMLLSEKVPYAYGRLQNDSAMAFSSFMDSVTTVKTELLTSYEDRLPTDFYYLEFAKIKYEKINYLSLLLSYYINNKKDLPTNETYYTYRSEMNVNGDKLVDIPQYKSAVSNEISIGLIQDQDWNDPTSRLTYFNRFIDKADSIIDSESVLGAILYQHLDRYKTYVDIDAVESRLDEYQSIFPKEDYQEFKIAISRIRLLAPGAEVPDFTFTALDDSEVSLGDFKGNLIYIDLWATWCGPCLREQPFMEKLVDEFVGKPVTFLAISIDNTPEPWKKMVPKRELSGVHVYAEGAWSSDIIKHFVVEGIPRYILLDTEGRIIDQNAPRPSGNIADVITEELAKI